MCDEFKPTNGCYMNTSNKHFEGVVAENAELNLADELKHFLPGDEADKAKIDNVGLSSNGHEIAQDNVLIISVLVDDPTRTCPKG